MTPTPTPLEQLALKCETASGPSFDTNRAILAALGYTWRGLAYWHSDEKRMWNGSVLFTESIDAAMTLVGDNWWNVESGCDGLFFAKVLPWSADCRTGTARHGATPALALTAAALRARAKIAKEPTR